MNRTIVAARPLRRLSALLSRPLTNGRLIIVRSVALANCCPLGSYAQGGRIPVAREVGLASPRNDRVLYAQTKKCRFSLLNYGTRGRHADTIGGTLQQSIADNRAFLKQEGVWGVRRPIAKANGPGPWGADHLTGKVVAWNASVSLSATITTCFANV